MGIREILEKQKKAVIPAFALVVAGVVAYSYFNGRDDRQLPGPIDRAYFTDDEGKTYFADELLKAVPFDHNGKKAYRAYVFQCDDRNEPFVGLLGQQVAVAQPTPDKRYVSSGVASSAIEIRKPSGGEWVQFNSEAGQKLLDSVCPKGRPIPVMP